MEEEGRNNKHFVPSNTSTPAEEITKASCANDVSISPIENENQPMKSANENHEGGNEVSDLTEINPSTSSLPTTSRSQNESDVVEAPTLKRKHREPLESIWENVDLTNLSNETKDEFDALHPSKSSTVPVKKEEIGFQIFHDSDEEVDQADSAERSKKKKTAFFHLLGLSNRDENDHGTVQHMPSGQDSLNLATGQAGVNGFNVWHDSSEETDQTETPVIKIKHRKPLKVLFRNEDDSQEHPEKSGQSGFEIWQDALEETECQQSEAVGTMKSNVAGVGDPTFVIPSTSGMHTRGENKECQQSNVVVTSDVTGISGDGFLVWHDSFQGDDQADESVQDSGIPPTSS